MPCFAGLKGPETLMAPVETESVSLIIASQITKSLTGAFLFIAVIVLLIYC